LNVFAPGDGYNYTNVFINSATMKKITVTPGTPLTFDMQMQAYNGKTWTSPLPYGGGAEVYITVTAVSSQILAGTSTLALGAVTPNASMAYDYTGSVLVTMAENYTDLYVQFAGTPILAISAPLRLPVSVTAVANAQSTIVIPGPVYIGHSNYLMLVARDTYGNQLSPRALATSKITAALCADNAAKSTCYNTSSDGIVANPDGTFSLEVDYPDTADSWYFFVNISGTKVKNSPVTVNPVYYPLIDAVLGPVVNELTVGLPVVCIALATALVLLLVNTVWLEHCARFL
jgi:hypothetical protein